MKELSIEEKARAYDEALEVINKCETDKYGCIIGIKPSDILPELKENEDEKLRKGLIGHLKGCRNQCRSEVMIREYAKWISWLEKQDEHAKFRDSIQVGNKVTRNQDGVLVNLSQLNRVAKKQDSQILANSRKTCKDEQKPTWGEEDDAMFNFIALILRNHQSDEDFTTFETTFKDCIDWFKNLKDRVHPQPKKEWSETEELYIAWLIEHLYGIEDKDKQYESKCRTVANWLTSLRPQTT